MEYLDRISDLIHHKRDYESAAYYIQEVLSNKGLSIEVQDLLRLKLRYCNLKLGKFNSAFRADSKSPCLGSRDALEINLEKPR